VLAAVVLAGLATSATPYEVDWLADGARLAGLQALMLTLDAVEPSLAPLDRCQKTAGGTHCDPNRLNGLDRSVVGNHSRRWDRASDLGRSSALALAVVGTGALALMDDTATPWRDAATDLLVLATAISAASLTTSSLKLALGRSRPLQYSADSYELSLERDLSFPSGHVTTTAAAMAALATTVAYRKPWSVWAYSAAGAAVLLTGLVAHGRVQAGMHFYTDVAAGAAVGGLAGVLIPKLFERREILITPMLGETKGLMLTVRF
jgi:membrane-associated phospholipid phosphatase